MRRVNRCLDYMITNVPAEPGIEEIQHSTQAYSDHKLMICSCQIRGEPRAAMAAAGHGPVRDSRKLQ